MRRRTALFTLAALPASLARGLRAPRGVAAADEQRVLLPTIRGGAHVVSSSLTTLVNADCGLVSVALIPGTARVLVAYTVRPASILYIGEDIGSSLSDVPNPDLALLLLGNLDPSPSFAFPGPKQGSASMVVVGQELRIYATSRDEGDPSGPFKVKRLTMPVPPPPA